MKLSYSNCRRNRFALLRTVACSLLMSVLLVACRPSGNAAETHDALPVVAVDVLSPEPHSIQTVLPGRIVAMHTAEVRARVTGIVQKRLFTEGSDVKAGQILFQIDPAALRAELARARGVLAGAQATVIAANEVVDRYRPLLEQDAISRMAFSNAIADQGKAIAARDAARAALQSAQIDLDHATVRAPIAGRIGYALVSEGGLVSQTEATPLALVQSIDSVYVDLVQLASAPRFSSAETPSSGNSKAGATNKRTADVSIDIDKGAGPAILGKMQFEDISVESGTGQVRSRAVLRNPEHRLLPGMYVRATVTTGSDDQALFVSQKSLRFAADGIATVQEVDDEHVLRIRKLVLGDMQGTRWQVLSGVKAGANIVTNYTDGVPTGTKVNPQSSSSAASTLPSAA